MDSATKFRILSTEIVQDWPSGFAGKSDAGGMGVRIVIYTVSFVFQSYEAAFQTIKEATGIEDIDLLVSKFIEVEDKNFALFNYVNELNNEIELLQEQINEVNLVLLLFSMLVFFKVSSEP